MKGWPRIACLVILAAATIAPNLSASSSPGHYLLLDFKNERRVDHVRFVARTATPEARVVLRMEK